MLRSSLIAASAIALMAGASAQNSVHALNAERIPGAIKHAGIYHVATGTWTRTSGAVGNCGPDVIYYNTAPSGYYTSAGGNGGFAPGSTNFDEGNVPSSLNTNNAGNRDEYNVNCISIGYCDFGTSSSGWEVSFYTSYAPCTFDPTPDATIDTGAAPSNGCWTVELDLSGGAELCLGADGGDGFDDDISLDAFGWSYRYTGSGAGLAGFLLTGDPQSTDPNWIPGSDPIDGTNTYFGPPSMCGVTSTGLRTQDSWFIEDPVTGTNSGCYFFGGYSNNNSCGGPANPYASFYMCIKADTGPCSDVISSPNGCTSNPNSNGINSTMLVTGSTSIASDVVTLTAFVPLNTFGFFITAQTAGFIQMPAGSSGNICLGANVGRFQALAASSGAVGIIDISTTAGQWSVTNIPQASGAYAAVPGGSAHFQLWHRDVGPMGPTSNFTDGVVVTWTP